MMSIVQDIQGTREFAQQLILNHPGLRMRHPGNEGVFLHPFIEPSFALMGKRYPLSATHTPKTGGNK
jgi:hypothetical protein